MKKLIMVFLLSFLGVPTVAASEPDCPCFDANMIVGICDSIIRNGGGFAHQEGLNTVHAICGIPAPPRLRYWEFRLWFAPYPPKFDNACETKFYSGPSNNINELNVVTIREQGSMTTEQADACELELQVADSILSGD